MDVHQPVAARHGGGLRDYGVAGDQPTASGLYLMARGPTDGAATTAKTTTATMAPASTSAAGGDIPAQTEPPTSANLTNWLNAFYASEQKRKTPFPDQLPADAQPFDLLVINICSLSWSDIEAAGLMDHPLWKHFDIVFKTLTRRPPTAARRRYDCCAQAVASCRIRTSINRRAATVTCSKIWQNSALPNS